MMNLNTYEYNVNQLRKYAKKNGISEQELNVIFKKCFDQLEKEQMGFVSFILFIGKVLTTLFLIITFCTFLLYNHPTTHNFVLRNVQLFIYPGLTLLRKIAVPVITKYPDLTNLYDEWCLIENPYFRISDMDCMPCSSIISVPDLTGHNITKTFNIGIPFTKVEKHNKICFQHLLDLYNKKKNIFDIDAKNIVSNNLSYRTISDIMKHNLHEHPSPNEDIHVTWRIMRINIGRLLRKIFLRPSGVPDWWGQSTEKFIFLDEPKAPSYILPNPECSNVILQCTSGARLIRLEPSPECKQKCQILTVLLSAGQSLWYNWWYWRPKSLPITNETEISINHLTSYC